MSKFRLWLLAHGVEFEIGDSGDAHTVRSFSIVINHRFYGVELALIAVPFKGVFKDELDTPHAEIAEEREADHPL